MGIGSRPDFSAGRRASRVAKWIAIVGGLMSAGAIVGVAMAGLLPQGSELIVSAPFRW